MQHPDVKFLRSKSDTPQLCLSQSARITTGIALVGASLIAVTPVATPLPDVQHRQFRLTDYDEFDLSQLASATETNWSGLETVLSSSHWLTDPDISQGLSAVLSDLSTGASNPVTNPLSLLTEGALALLSSSDASNAASTALTAVSDNIESALSSDAYSTALTDLENAPTTILYAYLNGYPETRGSGLISPELGLLTNTADGAITGEIDALQQLGNTVADELSAVGGRRREFDDDPDPAGTRLLGPFCQRQHNPQRPCPQRHSLPAVQPGQSSRRRRPQRRTQPAGLRGRSPRRRRTQR
jgi:hypothetical protein